MGRLLLISSLNEISSAIRKELDTEFDEIIEIQPNEEELVIAKGSYHSYDFNKASDFESWFVKEVDFQSGFDGVVFSLGKGGVRPLKLNKPDFVENMFQQNVFSFIEVMRVLSKKRALNTGASIVAISSVSGIKGLKSKVVYSASKSALEGAVRSCAAELGDKKIRVNAILKGWVTSDMNLDFIQNNMSLSENEDLKKQFLGPIEPQEVADLVAYLLSDKAKSITGTSILLDGGYCL